MLIIPIFRHEEVRRRVITKDGVSYQEILPNDYRNSLPKSLRYVWVLAAFIAFVIGFYCNYFYSNYHPYGRTSIDTLEVLMAFVIGMICVLVTILIPMAIITLFEFLTDGE